MWKIVPTWIREKNTSFKSHELFPEEKKGHREGTITYRQTYFNDVRASKKFRHSLDRLQKEFEKIPQIWQKEFMNMFKFSVQIVNFFKRAIKTGEKK